MTADTDPTLLDEDQADEHGDGEDAGAEPATPRRRRSEAPRSRRSQGRRTRARRQRRRRTLVRSSGAVVAAVAVGIAAVVGAGYLVASNDAEPDAGPAPVETPDRDPQPTLVVATFDEAAPARGATEVMVLGYDRATEQATIVFVPSSTAADVPGHGLLQVGRAYGFGEGPLLDATLDNLLGVDFDHVVGVSQQGWASLFTRVGGLTIEVPERLDQRMDDGTSQARFRPGEQFLDGPRLAELLTFREDGESELEVLPRTQLVVLALLDAIAADPSVLDPVFEDGAPMLETGAEAVDVRELLLRLAEASTRDQLVVRTLPVSPIGTGEADSYRVDEERAPELVRQRFGASIPTGAAEGGRDLQILNGNGVPGIGQKVAERLLPAGFRVVLTRNADTFDHAETRIVVYEDTPAQLAAAEQIRSLLGVGTIELSRTPQSVADITIVVGLDFLDRG